MNKPTGAALNAGSSPCSSSRTRKEGKLTSYFQVVNYLSAMDAPDDIIAGDDMNTMNIQQPAGQSAQQIRASTLDEGTTLQNRLRWILARGNIQ